MTKKNTQIADTPRKEPRQYKHTPRKTKRLTSKIFAFVGCLVVLLSIVVIPSSAFGVADTSNSTIPQVHSYAPTTITYNSRYFGGDYAVLDAPTAYGAVGGYSANFLGNGIKTTYHTATASDKLNGYFLVVLNDYGDYPVLRFTHDRFYYTSEYSDITPRYTITSDEYAYWRVYVSGYFSNRSDGQSFTYADEVPVYTSSGSFLRFGFYDVIEGLRTYYGLSSDIPINSERLTVTVVGYASEDIQDGLNVDMSITQIACEYPFISTYTPRSSYVYTPSSFEYVSPEAIEPSGLFSWLADALNGVLHAPLVPIGDNTITIGSVVGMLLGISLVIAFLKFFAGG